MSYNPSVAKDAVTAKSLAISFRDNTAHKTIQQIAADPANGAAIRAFQTAAGIGVDGKVGPETLGAYNYYIGKPQTTTASTAKTSAVPITAVQMTAFDKAKLSLPSFPILLSVSLLGLGAVVAIWKASK